MGPDHGVIDAVYLPIEPAGGIGLSRQRVKRALEDAGFLPAVEAAGHRAPGAIAFRQIRPGSAGTENPQHPVEEAAMVDGRASRR